MTLNVLKGRKTEIKPKTKTFKSGIHDYFVLDPYPLRNTVPVYQPKALYRLLADSYEFEHKQIMSHLAKKNTFKTCKRNIQGLLKNNMGLKLL